MNLKKNEFSEFLEHGIALFGLSMLASTIWYTYNFCEKVQKRKETPPVQQPAKIKHQDVKPLSHLDAENVKTR